MSVLGVLPSVMTRGRKLIWATTIFFLANTALLLKVESDLSVVANPGPDARGIAMLFHIPSAIFLLSGMLRLLVEIGRFVNSRKTN